MFIKLEKGKAEVINLCAVSQERIKSFSNVSLRNHWRLTLHFLFLELPIKCIFQMQRKCDAMAIFSAVQKLCGRILGRAVYVGVCGYTLVCLQMPINKCSDYIKTHKTIV